jgi:hypothetical protein
MSDPAPNRVPLGALRIFLVVVGVATTLFSGGCSIFVLSDGFQVWPFTLAFGGAPFVLGLLVTWMALKLGRRPAPADRAAGGDPP